MKKACVIDLGYITLPLVILYKYKEFESVVVKDMKVIDFNGVIK